MSFEQLEKEIKRDLKKDKVTKDNCLDMLAHLIAYTCEFEDYDYKGSGQIEDDWNTIDLYKSCGVNKTNQKPQSNPPKKELLTPMEIKSLLDKTVVGQDKTKMRIATEVFKHYLKMQNEDKLYEKDKTITKSNVFLTGLTGTGKTFLWQQIAKILDVPIYIQDCTNLTIAGYAGSDVEVALKGLVDNANGNIDRAERGIVILDEFDKIADSFTPNGQKDPNGKAVQQALLKMIEGDVCTLPDGQRGSTTGSGAKINTANILFVACGSFDGIERIVKQRMNQGNTQRTIGFGANNSTAKEELSIKDIRANITRDDLKEFGIISEILGRFPILSNLHPLEKEDLVNILKTKNSLFSEYETLFELMNKQLVIKEEVFEFIANEAISKNIGARGLRAIVEEIMCPIMYNMPSDKKKKYVVDLSMCKEAGINIKKVA